jgi:hypothetical protein
VERAPYFSNAPAEGSTIQVDSETYLPGTPYTLNIYGTDPDASDSSTANKLAVTVDVTQITGMPEPPAPPTAPANPFSAGSSAVTGEATRWTADWAINDSHTPVKYAVHATVCDHNPSNHPVEDYAYYFVTYNPAIISLIPGTVAPFQYDHFCIERNFTVHAPKRNYTPVITSTAGAIGKGNMSGLPEQKYVYDITVTDDNTTPADTLSFALITAPAGMTITTLDNTGPSASAKIEWKPNNSTQLGINNVKLRVSDSNSYPGGAHFVEQSFQIFVTEYNLAPVITRPVREVATNGVEYALTPNATDPNITSPYNRLKYYLDSAPTGMTIDVNTGKIKWTPSVAQAKLGTADVTLRVEDQAPTIPVNERLSDTKTFTITLNYVNRAPVFVDIPPQTIPLHMEYVLNILTTDEDGDTFTMTSGALPSGAVFTDNGDGTATFTWTPTTEETVTITASILDSAGNSASQDIEITTVNKPVFRSHPVTSANSNGTYTYELNALDPAGEGLTYTIETGPSGMSISGNTVTWTPNPSQVGNQQVIIKAIDGNDHEGVQEYNITVLSTPNTAPVASTILPDNAQTVIATEGKELTLTVAGTDSETDPLHYTWYKHNGTAYAWSDDTNGTFKLTPTDTDNGDTSVRCDITDGATITQVVFNIHIRNSIPVMPTAGTGLYSYSSGGPVLQVVESERAGKISVLRGGASPRLEIFNTANISTGAAAFASGFAFTPARMTVRNTYADTSLLMVYFAKNGEITNLAGQDYFSVGSDSMSIGSVNATTGFQSSFNNSYEFSGGTNEAFKVTGSIKRFNIKPTDRTKLMSAISGTEQAEVALPSAGKALVYDSADDKLFVALASTDQILVMNPNTLAVTATINLPAGASPSLLYINTTSRKLYVYNAGNGTLTEINAQSNAIGTTVENLPTMTVSNDPASLIAGDDADNIVYLIDPSGGKLYTIDAVYNTFRSLDVTGLVNINFSPITKRLLGATNNKLFFLK